MNHGIKEIFIGHSTDDDIRYKASSGGVATAIIKYLLDGRRVDSALTFRFDKEECRYEPLLIHDFADYNNCGSVYQEFDITGYVKKNIREIGESVVLTCPPCQVGALRAILKKEGIRSFIISFLCSGQTLVEGTYAYYEMVGIDKNEVENIQYRGNGWPSGIQIALKSGEKFFRPNYTEPWSTINRSKLFQPKRCYYCKTAVNEKADLTVADPWLKEYAADKIGNSMVLVQSEEGKAVIDEMTRQGLLQMVQSDYESFAIAQRPNLEKARKVGDEKSLLDFLVKLGENKRYRSWATKSHTNLKRHIKFVGLLNSLYRKSKAMTVANILLLPKKVLTKIKGGGSSAHIGKDVSVGWALILTKAKM